MAVRALCGVPGSGKTLEATRIALKHYRKENNIIRKNLMRIGSILNIKKCVDEYRYYSIFPHGRINNVYSNYPILLDKKRNIYSNSVTLWQLNNDYSFFPNALIIIDEVQLYADSDEYKDKNINKMLRKVAKFLQAHRHFAIRDVIFISQHPSRIFKKARNICESYLKLRKMFRIPFTPFAFIIATGYYEFDFYGRYIPRSHEEKKKLCFDYYKYFKIFNCKKVFNSYDSRYLSLYNFNKILLSGEYSSLKLNFDFLSELFDEKE